MHQPAKWWIGLVPLLLCWVAANVIEDGQVEAELGGKAAAVLQTMPTDMVDHPAATVAGRDVTLTGAVFVEPDGVSLADKVGGRWGVRRVVAAFTAPPLAHPYGLTQTREGGAVVLAGSVPSPAARTAILAAAAAANPGATIDDRLAYARGAPQAYDALVAKGLAEAGKLDDGSFSIADDAYSIEGAAKTNAIYEAALAATKSLPRGATLAKAAILPPEVAPFVWRVTNKNGAVTLAGVVPTPEARDTIAAKAVALFPKAHVANTMAVARGAPDGFSAAAGFVLAELGKLDDGDASIDGASMSLRGTAADAATHAAVTVDMTSGLPSGYRLGTLALLAAPVSPYTFAIDKDDGEVHLTGYVPDEATHGKIVEAAKARFFEDRIVDELKIGSGAPKDFLGAVTGALPAFARLADGRLVLSDRQVTVTGRAIYAKAADAVKSALGAGVAGYAITPVITVKPPGPALDPPACQPKFRDLLAKGHIEFETASATLKTDSTPLLDDLVAIAQRCRTASIEVSGHTDAVGAATSNLDLSKRRAEAVVHFLADAGIDTSRIVATGYGQDKPIASNDTADGRARNRRIEFQVK